MFTKPVNYGKLPGGIKWGCGIVQQCSARVQQPSTHTYHSYANRQCLQIHLESTLLTCLCCRLQAPTPVPIAYHSISLSAFLVALQLFTTFRFDSVFAHPTTSTMVTSGESLTPVAQHVTDRTSFLVTLPRKAHLLRPQRMGRKCQAHNMQCRAYKTAVLKSCCALACAQAMPVCHNTSIMEE